MTFQTEMNYLLDEFSSNNARIDELAHWIDMNHGAMSLCYKEIDELEVRELYKIHLQVSVHQLVNM